MSNLRAVAQSIKLYDQFYLINNQVCIFPDGIIFSGTSGKRTITIRAMITSKFPLNTWILQDSVNSSTAFNHDSIDGANKPGAKKSV
jgi:hypothetical protein